MLDFNDFLKTVKRNPPLSDAEVEKLRRNYEEWRYESEAALDRFRQYYEREITKHKQLVDEAQKHGSPLPAELYKTLAPRSADYLLDTTNWRLIKAIVQERHKHSAPKEEILQLRPSFYGIGLNLKAIGRRLKAWFKNRRR
jgi:hypothetical protein